MPATTDARNAIIPSPSYDQNAEPHYAAADRYCRQLRSLPGRDWPPFSLRQPPQQVRSL